MSRVKLNIEECHRVAEEKDGKCLSDKYINTRTKMKWECNKCKCVWETTFASIKSGRWCPRCSGHERYTIELCHKLAKKKGIKCLSTEYKNSKTEVIVYAYSYVGELIVV